MRAGQFSSRVLWSLWLVYGTTAENTNGVTWQYPTSGLTFYYLDTVQVTYTSNFSDPNLYTFCSDGNGGTIQKKLAAATPYNGTTPTVLDFTDASSACWFNLRPGFVAGFGSNSDVFEFKIGQRSQTTLGPDSSSSATITATSSVASATSSATSSATAVATTGLSTGAQAGIGVGAALAGLALGAFAATIFIRRRRNKKQPPMVDLQDTSMPSQYPGSDYQGSLAYGPSPAMYSGQSNAHKSQFETAVPMHNPQELGTESVLVELDGR
ncbi:hypothetical protein F4775DRAFT_562800 [Biscogniauxia sp. FL1348]|nr:hypothetical protein F4775DRAFT_562800 [Biscogniauxia sp. FL1348]